MQRDSLSALVRPFQVHPLQEEARGSAPLTQFDAVKLTGVKEEPWDTFLITKLRQKDTGLPMAVYVSLRQGGQGPRIKVSQSYGDRYREGESFTVTVEEEPRVIGDKAKISKADVELVKAWVKVNQAKLEEIWNDELHPFDAHFR